LSLAEDLVLMLQTQRYLIAVLIAFGASACSPRQVDLRFRSDGAILSGTLVLPAGHAPYPAIVLVHGDGPETRAGYRYFAQRLAASGIAALIYDKRGVGESTGRWPASFEELAADAAAAMAYLRSRREIDRERVGLWGGSQGGWIAPLAATLPSARPRCIVIKSGAGVGPADLARWKSITRVQQAGYPADVIGRVHRLMDLQFEILRSDTGWDDLAAQVQELRTEPWFPLVAVMRYSPWRSSWMTYGQDIAFDPLPVLRRLDAPVLWILGEKDPETPLAETLATIQQLRDEGKDIAVIVFPDADHQIELPRTQEHRPNFAPGYMEGMVEWVVDRCAERPGRRS
jgi:dienelactone hydrolase